MDVSNMVNRLARGMAETDTPGDYRENGIVHCAVCGEPKQARKQLPDGKGGFVERLVPISCYNSSIGKTRIKMQTFRIIDENPSHENAAPKLVLAAVRFFILAVLIRFKQHSAPPYETTFLPFFSLPLSARRCAMI